MKAYFWLFLLMNASLATQDPASESQDSALPICSNFIQNFPEYTCVQTEFYPAYPDEWQHVELINGNDESSKITIRIKKITEEAKEGAEQTIITFKNVTFPTLPKSIKYLYEDEYIVQILDGSGYLSAINELKSESGFKVARADVKYLNSMAKLLNAFHRVGWVLADVNMNNLLVKFELTNALAEAVLVEYNLAVRMGSPIDYRGDFRYWELGRFSEPQKPAEFDEAVDAYAAGVAIYAILHKGKLPFEGETKEEFLANLEKGEYVVSAEIEPELAVLITSLLDGNRKRRISLPALIEMSEWVVANPSGNHVQKTINANINKGVPPELLELSSDKFLERLNMELRDSVPVANLDNGGKTNLIMEAFRAYLLVVILGLIVILFGIYFVYKIVKDDGADGQNSEMKREFDVTPDFSGPSRVSLESPGSVIRIEEAD